MRSPLGDDLVSALTVISGVTFNSRPRDDFPQIVLQEVDRRASSDATGEDGERQDKLQPSKIVKQAQSADLGE